MLALIASLVIATAGEAADVWSTVKGIRAGLAEANPLLNSGGKFVEWRAIAIKGLVYVSPVMGSLMHQPGWLIVACGAMSGAAGVYSRRNHSGGHCRSVASASVALISSQPAAIHCSNCWSDTAP